MSANEENPLVHENKKLSKQIKKLERNLKRSDEARIYLENAKDQYDEISKRIIEELNEKSEALEQRIEEVNTIQLAMLNIMEDLDVAKLKAQESNQKMSDSIRFASLIQGALIPEIELINQYFKETFIIWEPKDVVGGDIYLLESLNEHEVIIMVIDCTGHGVPGALVTMLVKAIERQIISTIKTNDYISPASMLGIFNRQLKLLLNQEGSESISNAGFDGGILYYNKKEALIRYAGSRTPLFISANNEIKMIKTDRHSIGYKDSDMNYEFTDNDIAVETGMTFYLTTDGFIDQNGGEKDFPFSKVRLKKLLIEVQELDMTNQKESLIKALSDYQGRQERNDDITFIGLKI